MSKLTIYNTNKSQVYPEDEEDNRKNNNIDTYIDNAIEYYINNRKNRIIALVRADAPQVEGRDKANFYIEFNSDTSENLTKELVNHLDQHSSNTGWKFHTDEPRWATPWFVAESEVDDPADLEFSNASILTVQHLIQDGSALDFGFSGYEDAATVLSYFTEQENAQASYAIASNGRKRVIQSAELVLQPGRYDNFELLSEDTRDQIAQRHDELKSDAKLSYQDETIEFINSIQDAPELSPIQALDDLHYLDTIISNNSNVSASDLEPYSSSASNAVTRINAVKNRRYIDDAPPIHFLDTDQREKIITDTQNLIREKKSELEQNLVSKVLSSLANHLTELEREPPGSVINEISEIEEQLSSGQQRADHPKPGDNAIGHILELVSHIKTSEFLDQNKKENLYQVTSDRLSEFKSGLREQRKKKIEDEINACVNSFPSRDNPDSYHILNNISNIAKSIDNLSNLDDLPDDIRRHEKNINKTIKRISTDQIIEPKEKSDLQISFTRSIEEYRSKIKIGEKNAIENKIDEEIKSLETKLTKQQEYKIYSKTSINRIFSDEFPLEYQELSGFKQIYKDLNSQSIFSEEDVNEMKRLLKNKLNDRRNEIVEKQKEDLIRKAKRYREGVIRRVDGKENIPLQVEKIGKIHDYLHAKIDEEGLPNEIRGPYLRNLKILSERVSHEILDPEQISQIRHKLKENRKERIRELNKEYKENIESQLKESVSRLDADLGNQYRLKIQELKKLRSYINTKSDSYIRKSDFNNLSSDYRFTVHHIIELINKSKKPNPVLSQEDRNQIRESIVDDLDGHISKAQSSLLEEQKSKFEEYLNENYSESNTKQAHQSIDELRQIKLRLQHGGTAYSVPDTAIKQLKIIDSNKLDESHKNEFNNYIIPEIESLIENLQKRVRNNLKTKILDDLETIAGNDRKCNTKIKKMQAVSNLVDPSSSANKDLLDQALINSVDIVEEHELESIFSDANNKAQNLIDEQLEEHSEKLYDGVVHICKNSSSADKILDTFSEHLNSHEQASVDDIDDDKLREVCEEYKYIKKLAASGAISEGQFKTYKSKLEGKVEQLNQEFGSENIVDRLRDGWR